MLVDSHCHLNFPEFSGRLDAVVEDARAMDVGYMQTICTRMREFPTILKIEKQYDNVWCSVGVHPNNVAEEPPVTAEEIIAACQNPEVIGIGETGLDYFRTPPELRARQQESFKWHIELAKKTSKALVIHDRDSHEDVLSVLLEVGAPEKVIFHCFSGDVEMAKTCIERGYVLSFAGTLTFKNAPALRDAVKLVPIDQLLVETDSPFLAPMPQRGALNTPAQIANIVRAMAVERNADLGELATALGNNAERLFGSFAS
jgi:TatD DNase family protein